MPKRLLLISGVSGAGKTTASNILEDMGYLCMDQFPIELLPNLLELIAGDTSSRYDRVAITISLDNLSRYYQLLNNSNVDVQIILLDAASEVIINRYKFTRRVHPLLVSNRVNTLEEAIAYEKELLAKLTKPNTLVIDTSKLSLGDHKATLDKLLKYDDFLNFSVSFVSFGFTNGVPGDADLVFDVRFLDNPYYIEELRNKSGNDQEVYDYVMKKDATSEYLKYLLAYLDYTFKFYDAKEEKRHLTVCVGCTGGQHRSVSITNYLYEHYKDRYLCYKKHRELRDKS